MRSQLSSMEDPSDMTIVGDTMTKTLRSIHPHKFYLLGPQLQRSLPQPRQRIDRYKADDALLLSYPTWPGANSLPQIGPQAERNKGESQSEQHFLSIRAEAVDRVHVNHEINQHTDRPTRDQRANERASALFFLSSASLWPQRTPESGRGRGRRRARAVVHFGPLSDRFRR